MIPISDSIRAHRFPLLNISLIAANIFVFYLQFSAVNPDLFILQYALIPSQINISDFSTFYPFVTAMFLHGGILHIASNMLFLWVFGDNVETHFGWLFFLPVYFISGIVGNAVQYMLNPTSTIPMIGASGAVAGMLGAYYVLFPHARIKTLIPFFGFFSVIEIPAGFMLGYWFVLQILSGAVSLPMMDSQTGGIAFFAHIGGFAAGVLFAQLHPRDKVHSLSS
ncbi:MAG: rhomboid family intramembrane serine protease [Candidatus Levybacteria bacterium]|nr:rhomboid family intramembrane serine protease [Candidatus Levybacteria bacterium]